MIYAMLGLVRQYFQRRLRYRIALFWDVVFGWAIFALLFFGIQVSAGTGVYLGATTASLIVGFWVWQLTSSAFEGVGSYVSDEASVGTLEQLYLSPFPSWWVILSRALGNFIYDLSVYVPFLFLLMVTTGRWLHLDPVSIFPLITFAVAQAYGIGLVMAGVALIHKRVRVLGQVATMFFAVSIAAPQDFSPFIRLLPLNLEWRLVRDVMENGVPLWEVSAADLALVAIKTLVVVGFGCGIYKWCEGIAKRRALLGQY
jgi:ABC-2 type transport system permease protein